MFEVTARLKIRDGELDGFKRQAAEMMRQTREQDTKTLRYDWFLSHDGTECEVRESYGRRCPDRAFSARHRGQEQALQRLRLRPHVTLYGEPSPALAEALKAMLAGAVPIQAVLLVPGDSTPT